MTAWRMVVEAGRDAKTSLEIARELLPWWSGYLVVDGKSVRVGKEEWSWFLGLDVGSRDLVKERLLEGENRYDLLTYFRSLRDELRYRVKGVVSDLNPDIAWAIGQVWPGVPHQLCTTHMLRWVDHLLDYRAVLKRLKRREEKVEELLERLSRRPGPGRSRLLAELRDAKARLGLAARQARPTLWLRGKIEEFLLAKNKQHALAPYEQIRRRGWRYQGMGAKKALHSLEIHKEQLLIHFDHPKLPRNTNLLENVIRNFERRLKTIESFRRKETAEGYLRLMAIQYRCTPFTDCRRSHRAKNGKTPLALAHATVPRDWVSFSQSKKDPP
jgi:transposase-like protein